MNMKMLVTKDTLRSKMNEAIDMLCDTVKTTLGPKGSNTIIDHSSFTPFITNDGVTIAKNIESDDVVINTILELAKEAAINTDNKVGDGTTTTLVLLQSIYHNCLLAIENGQNPVILKKQLNTILPTIINKIRESSRRPTKKELLNIATISSNSQEIGETIYDAYTKVLNKSSIILKESNTSLTKINFQKGYSFETLLASPYFLSTEDNIELTNAKTLIYNSPLNDIEEISSILNEILISKENLLLFAEDYNEYFINQIITINNQENLHIFLFKLPSYGTNKLNIISDLSLLSNAEPILNPSLITKENIGLIKHIKINKDYTTITFTMTPSIKETIKILKNKLSTNLNDIDFTNTNNRLAMFTKGLVEIEIGAPTITEKREKKMRYTDALWAIDTANNGIIPGSGLILYKISEELDNSNPLFQIFSNALKEPLHEILSNAGLPKEGIISFIKQSNYQKIYNILKDEYEDISKTEVIDPTEVVINSLINATSIATMLITTTNLVINEYQNNLNKINDYNEL